MYITFIVVLVLAVISSQIIIQWSIYQQQEDTRIIKVAGEQRLLWEQISENTLNILNKLGVKKQKEQLAQALDKLKSNHHELSDRNDLLGLSVKNSPHIQNLFDELEEPYLIIVERGEKIISNTAQKKYKKFIYPIVAQEEPFLTSLEQIVVEHNVETEIRTEKLKQIEIGLALFTILIIILEIFLLINPVLKKLITRTYRLKISNNRLEEQAELISEQNERLKSATAKAIEATEAKSMFLSNMSHEIRTPMNAVIGLTHALLEKGPRVDQQDDLETIRFSAENLLVIINDILDYSKIEAGKLSIEKTTFNLSYVLSKLYKTLQPLAERKNLTFHFDIDAQVPKWINGDPTRLNQILINLINNAIKFTQRGKVTLKVYCTEIKNGAAAIHFAVSDTGIGIPKEKQATIFDSFSQADTSTTRVFGGTGLGLAITKRLIDLQQGKLELQSEPGQGSTFFFSIKYSIEKEPKQKFTGKGKQQDKTLEGTWKNSDCRGQCH